MHLKSIYHGSDMRHLKLKILNFLVAFNSVGSIPGLQTLVCFRTGRKRLFILYLVYFLKTMLPNTEYDYAGPADLSKGYLYPKGKEREGAGRGN